MKKLISLAFVAMLLIGLTGWFVVARQRSQPASGRMMLPDGTSVRILAVTYGTNHTFGTRLGSLTSELPDGLQHFLTRLGGQTLQPLQAMTTPTPELLLWLDRQTNSLTPATAAGGIFEAFLADGSNFISGDGATLISWIPVTQVEAIQFSVFPHRDPQITLHVYFHNASGVATECGTLAFANPLRQNFPEWNPEPLPETKRVGNVEVSLLEFHTGHDNNTSIGPRGDGTTGVTYGTNRLGGRNYSAVNLKIRPLASTNEAWQVAAVDVSDATGNSAHSTSMSWNGDYGGFAFSPSLWPGEAAWKLKLELKRSAGFLPEEMLVFKDVPLGEADHTNHLAWETNLAGITVTLQSLTRRPPQTNNSWSSAQMSEVKFRSSTLPTGTHLDLIRVVSNLGKDIQSGSWSSSSNERDYFFRDIPTDATMADFTFVVHQSRTVEFTVKPELPGPSGKDVNRR